MQNIMEKVEQTKDPNIKVRDVYFIDLTEDLKSRLMMMNKLVSETVDELLTNDKYSLLRDSVSIMKHIRTFTSKPDEQGEICCARVYKKGKGENNDDYECMIQLTGHFYINKNTEDEKLLHVFIKEVSDIVELEIKKDFNMVTDYEGDGSSRLEGMDVYTSSNIARELWDKFEDIPTKPLNESVVGEVRTDMSETQSKNTLRTLSQDLLNTFEKDKNSKVSQYTANIYANIITHNLLHKWSQGYKKFRITLDTYQSFPTVEFIVPPMTRDFVSRFINGRETLGGFLHSRPEIHIKMSPKIFHTMKNPDDAFYFFKSAIMYYNSRVETVGNRMMAQLMKLGHNMKYLIGNTNLRGLVTFPLTLIFIFDNVDITNRNTFAINNTDIQEINKFIRTIPSRYAAPSKERKKIVGDMKNLVERLTEMCAMSDTIRNLSYFPEAVNDLFSDKFSDMINDSSIEFIESNIDKEFHPEGQLKVIYERFKIKRLKRMPQDIVTYISIESENIRSSSDKMMIASYCISKLELVEWYIELLDFGSRRYIVPHDRRYLENLRTRLLACYKKIMDVKIEDRRDRPIIDIQYPKGYEG